ncbi:MAG: NYN domain-containing protein [Oscillospiraceae bacterium]|nr:NYN domain-containing protein [Oscillospiraceae bacterium]MCI9363630.1 NYN domain-containing protein [Oscillospiraceae bacterium]RKJ55201.1 NYN domain-containing protein [bacterium 1XD42-8]RKJ64319.1 NYN domain-containing protein [bacterium 1XD42-1]
MASDKKFAVLIDADNVSDKYIKFILDEVTNDGIATYKRIYGDWTSPALVSWKKVLLDHSVMPIQQYSYTSGKNSTDSAMIIDAMDILYSGQVDGFCLVSSDSDFTRLAARLRESGMLVVGMGERKTPKSFISACNRFKYLDILANSESKTKSKLDMQFGQMEKSKNYMLPLESEHVKEDMTNIKTIEDAIRAIAEEYSDEDEWIFTGTIGNLLVKRYPDFDVRNFGYRKLTAFLEALDLFDIKKVRTGDGDAKLIYVKLKN